MPAFFLVVALACVAFAIITAWATIKGLNA